MRKWWWAIWMWFLGVAVVNAYEIYKKKCALEGKRPMSHYDFQRLVALAWINPWNHGPPPKSPGPITNGVATRSGSSSSSSAGSKRKFREYVTLGLFDKAGHVRMDKTRRHWHQPCKKRTMCKLHRLWGRTTFADVFMCVECDTPLCVECWDSFHTVRTAEEMKAHLNTRFGPKEDGSSSAKKRKSPPSR